MAMPHTTTRKLSAFSSPRPVFSVTSAGVGHADRPRGGRTNIITGVASGGGPNPFKVTVSKPLGITPVWDRLPPSAPVSGRLHDFPDQAGARSFDQIRRFTRVFSAAGR